jgi:3-isopropylmalate/(R)-2-methylmalate dehydratase small subunit
MLPVKLSEEEVQSLMEAGEATIDLERQLVCFAGREVAFKINAEIRERLLLGQDEIALSLQQEAEIARFEQERQEIGALTTNL